MSEPPEWTAPDAGKPPPEPLPPAPPIGRDGPARPKPGIVPLRPLAVGEILDGAIAYIRSNPVATLGLSAVVITITQLIQLPIGIYLLGELRSVMQNPASPADVLALLATTMAGAVLGGFITFIATTILAGLLIVVLGQAVLGRRTSLGAAWAAARPRVPGLLGLALLSTVVLVVVMTIGLLPGLLTLLSGSGSSALIFIGFLVGFCAVLYLGICWSMATPAYVLEGIPVLAAYRRSYRLVRSQWWRVFGILLLGGIITAIVAFVLSLPFSLVTNLMGSGVDPMTGAITTAGLAATVVTTVGTIVGGTVSTPLSAGIGGLLYIDARMRREAFDLELLRAAESAGAPLPGAPAPDAGPPAPDPSA